MLRTAGPEAYDKWVSHELKFDSPEVQAAFDEAAKILKNDKFVNGGYGDVKSIPATSFQEGGLPILKGKCAMHKQASFYNSFWPKGTKVAVDGDVFAFYFPANDGKPVLGGGEIVGQFSDEPQVQSVALYLSSPAYANLRIVDCNCVMANNKTDVAGLRPTRSTSCRRRSSPTRRRCSDSTRPTSCRARWVRARSGPAWSTGSTERPPRTSRPPSSSPGRRRRSESRKTVVRLGDAIAASAA